MPIERPSFAGIHEASGYAHAVRAGNTVYVAGQVGVDPAGEIAGAGDFLAQARQAYANLTTILDQLGGSWANVVKTTTYLTDGRLLEPFRAVRREAMAGHETANTLLVVAGLGKPELMIEIEAVVVLD